MQVISRVDAKAQGLKVYFTGEPCKQGHTVGRYVATCKCVECAHQANTSDAAREYREANKAVQKDRAKAHYETHKLAYVERSAAYRKADPERWAAYQAKYRSENKDKGLAQCRQRQAAKLNATPTWIERKAIEEIYATAAFMTYTTGIPHHVDHIVPLRSPLVCGLHVAANLRVVEASENMAKSNRDWPEMWEAERG